MSGAEGAKGEPEGERATHLGVHWYRDRHGAVSFYDVSGQEWVRWRRGGDAPPLPPNWQILGVPTRFTRAGWRSPLRWVPAVIVVAAVVIGIVQGLSPKRESPSQAAAKETQQAEGLMGKCLAQDGTADGHPKYAPKPVDCDSDKAAVKVVKVLPPRSPTLCAAGTTAVELPYAGVAYPHIECLQPLPATG